MKPRVLDPKNNRPRASTSPARSARSTAIFIWKRETSPSASSWENSPGRKPRRNRLGTNAQAHPLRPRRGLAGFRREGQRSRAGEAPFLAGACKRNSSRTSRSERFRPAAKSARDRWISFRNLGLVLSESDSRSTFRRGTIAATGRFLFIKTTISSSSSSAYSASGRNACDSLMVLISLFPLLRSAAHFQLFFRWP
jgi:hypothetical protein